MFITLPTMGLLSVQGTDAAKFLQGQLTCDVNQITEHHALLGAYCSLQGRVQTIFELFALDSSFYLLMPAELISPTISLLQKYAVFSKVTLTAAEHLAVLGFIGDPNLLAITEKDRVQLVKHSGTVRRYWLVGSTADLAAFQARHSQISVNSYALWKQVDIAEGMPALYLTTKDLFTPHMLNLDSLGGISFSKGCYLGQEIIARTHYRGQVKQSLYRITLSTTDSSATLPAAGEKIIDDNQQPIGTLIDSIPIQQDLSSGKTFSALAVLQKAAVQEDVSHLPFSISGYVMRLSL